MPNIIGQYQGECNRSVCHNTGDLVRWYNKSTKQFYCTDCASLINEANTSDSLRLYNDPDLCNYISVEKFKNFNK